MAKPHQKHERASEPPPPPKVEKVVPEVAPPPLPKGTQQKKDEKGRPLHTWAVTHPGEPTIEVQAANEEEAVDKYMGLLTIRSSPLTFEVMAVGPVVLDEVAKH